MSVAVISPRTVRGLLSTDQITMSGSGKAKLMRRLPLESFRKGVAFAPTETIRGGISGYVAGVLVIHVCIEYQANKLGEAV